jgi:hypothetical protein
MFALFMGGMFAIISQIPGADIDMFGRSAPRARSILASAASASAWFSSSSRQSSPPSSGAAKARGNIMIVYLFFVATPRKTNTHYSGQIATKFELLTGFLGETENRPTNTN